VLLGTRRGLALAAALIVAAPLIRTGMWIFTPERRIEIGEAFSTIGDALATGCLLAGLQDWLASRPAYSRFLRSGWFAVVRCWALPPTPVRATRSFDCLIGQTVLNLAIALCIDRCRRLPDGRVGRLLENPPAGWGWACSATRSTSGKSPSSIGSLAHH